MLSNSVLNTVKEMIGPSQGYDVFDTDLLVLINSSLNVLAQKSIVKDGTKIKDETTTWEEILEGREDLEMIKEYLVLKVKMIFDASGSATIQQAYEKRANELEWLMYAFSDIIGKKQE